MFDRWRAQLGWLVFCLVCWTAVAFAAVESQDYATLMAAADEAALAGNYATADGLYARAVRVSLGNRRAINGLAWMKLRRGDACAASHLFDQVLAGNPTDASAVAGRRVIHQWPQGVAASVSVHDYQGDLYKQSAVGYLVGSEFPLAGAMSGALHIRRTVFAVNSPAEMGFGTALDPTQMIQHEGWFRLGLGNPCLGLDGHLGLWDNNGGWNEKGAVFGASAHWNRLVRWRAAALVTRYPDDGNRTQFDLSGSRPLGNRLRLEAGLSVQDAGGAAPLSTLVRGSWLQGQWWASAAWRGGRQVRPVRLLEPSVYNIPQDVDGGWSLSAGKRFGGRWHLSGEIERQQFARAPFPYWNAATSTYDTWPAETSHLVLVTVGVSYYR